MSQKPRTPRNPPAAPRPAPRGTRNPNQELDTEGFSLLHIIGIFGLALVFFALGYWLISRQFDTVPRYLAAAGILLIGVFFWFNPTTLGGLFSSRGARNSGNAFVLIAAVIGIVIVLNLLAGRYLTARADLTTNRQFSLSDQSRTILGQFQDELRATAYYSQNNINHDKARDLLESYRAASPNFVYEVVDSDQDPIRRRQSGLPGDGIVLETKRGGSNAKQQVTEQPDEGTVTGALIRLLDPTPSTVYFLSGHLEHELGDSGVGGYSTLAAALKLNNYVVSTINLDTLQAITNTGISVLVIPGPEIAFSTGDRQKIESFNRAGGRLLVMLDAPLILRDGPAALSSTNQLLAPFGVSFADGLLVDDGPQSAIQGFPYNVFRATDYSFASITRAFKNNGTTLPNVLNAATAVLTNQPVVTGTGVVKSVLLQTNETAYLKSTATLLTQASVASTTTELGNRGEQRGKYILGVAIEQPASGTFSSTRLVALGNSRLISNATIDQQNFGGRSYNLDLVLNSINWLAQNETLSGIQAKTEDFRALSINQAQASLIFYVSTLFLPALVLLFGGVIWWRRR